MAHFLLFDALAVATGPELTVSGLKIQQTVSDATPHVDRLDFRLTLPDSKTQLDCVGSNLTVPTLDVMTICGDSPYGFSLRYMSHTELWLRIYHKQELYVSLAYVR